MNVSQSVQAGLLIPEPMNGTSTLRRYALTRYGRISSNVMGSPAHSLCGRAPVKLVGQIALQDPQGVLPRDLPDLPFAEPFRDQRVRELGQPGHIERGFHGPVVVRAQPHVIDPS